MRAAPCGLQPQQCALPALGAAAGWLGFGVNIFYSARWQEISQNFQPIACGVCGKQCHLSVRLQ